jgi:hypothetical protein
MKLEQILEKAEGLYVVPREYDRVLKNVYQQLRKKYSEHKRAGAFPTDKPFAEIEIETLADPDVVSRRLQKAGIKASVIGAETDPHSETGIGIPGSKVKKIKVSAMFTPKLLTFFTNKTI